MAQTTTKAILSRVLFAGYILVICFVCFISSNSIPDIKQDIFGIDIDKIIHFLLFTPFAFLTFLSFDHPARKGWNSVLFQFMTFVAGFLIAFATEVVQSYLPTRSMDTEDLLADTLAIAASCIFILIIDLTHKK